MAVRRLGMCAIPATECRLTECRLTEYRLLIRHQRARTASLRFAQFRDLASVQWVCRRTERTQAQIDREYHRKRAAIAREKSFSDPFDSGTHPAHKNGVARRF